MAKVEKKTEGKEQKLEKNSKKVSKSTYSKKKKVKKNILNGIAYVQSTFNNTIVSIADTNGNIISWSSAGQKGFKGSRKSTPYAAQIAADEAAADAAIADSPAALPLPHSAAAAAVAVCVGAAGPQHEQH